MEFGRVFPPDLAQRLAAQRGKDVQVQSRPVERGRLRLAVRRHVLLQIALRQPGHGECRRRRRREGILAPLDPVDRYCRPRPRLLGGQVAVPSDPGAL